jgi:hypothetical protein
VTHPSLLDKALSAVLEKIKMRLLLLFVEKRLGGVMWAALFVTRVFLGMCVPGWRWWGMLRMLFIHWQARYGATPPHHPQTQPVSVRSAPHTDDRGGAVAVATDF